MRRLTEAALAWGCPLVVYWQLYDLGLRDGVTIPRNVRPTNAQMNGLWLVPPDGTPRPIHSYFSDLSTKAILRCGLRTVNGHYVSPDDAGGGLVHGRLREYPYAKRALRHGLGQWRRCDRGHIDARSGMGALHDPQAERQRADWAGRYDRPPSWIRTLTSSPRGVAAGRTCSTRTEPRSDGGSNSQSSTFRRHAVMRLRRCSRASLRPAVPSSSPQLSNALGRPRGRAGTGIEPAPR